MSGHGKPTLKIGAYHLFLPLFGLKCSFKIEFGFKNEYHIFHFQLFFQVGASSCKIIDDKIPVIKEKLPIAKTGDASNMTKKGKTSCL